MGTIDIGSESAWDSDDITAEHRYAHPQFNPSIFRNNIGLLHLADATQALLDHPHISVLSLPTRADDNVNLIGKSGTVSGYGTVSNTGTEFGTLFYTDLTVIENIACSALFPNYTTSASICTSTVDGKSPCNGDTGSPLSIEIESFRNVVAGLVTFSIPDCTGGHPAMFEKVSPHLDWIEAVLNNETYTTTTTTTVRTTTGASSALSFSFVLLGGLFIIAFNLV